MALATDSDFLIYQMRVSFLRTQDPAGERILTFDDLHMPRSGRELGKTSNGSGNMGAGTSSPMSQSPQCQRRRNTSASEVRQQVAQNSNANAYIVGCGYYPEIDAVGSPPIEYTDNPYAYPPVNRPIAPYNHKEQNLPKQPPLAQRGVIPRNRSMKRNNRSAKVAPTEGGREEVVGVGVVVPRHPEIMGSELEDEYDEEDMDEGSFSLRRSLDTEWRRAVDVAQKTAETTDAGSLSDSGTQQDNTIGTGPQKKTRKNRTSNTIRLRRPTEQTDSTTSSNDNNNLSQLKRSVTLPTKRRSPGAMGVFESRYGRSRWAGGVGTAEGARQVSGWVGGATGAGGDSSVTGWDDSEDDELSFDSSARGRRGGADTQTWYGPRRGVRPVSVLPPPGAAPMPLRFGAEDSDDDIDLDEDDGLLGPSLSNNNPAATTAASSSVTGRSVVSTTVVSSVQTTRPSMDSKSVSFDNDMKDIEENAFFPDEPPLSSGLASLLQGNTQLKQNVFAEEFGSVSGISAASDRNGGLKLQCAIHCKGVSQKIMQLQVRPNATVEQMIGYSLLEYLDDGGQLPTELQDVVMWVLRITDEGKVDDDFPALDRTRAVSGLGVDEFAVCLATSDQIRLNEEARLRQGRPARMPRPLSTSSRPSPPSSSLSSAIATQRKQNEKLSAGEYRFRVAPRIETSAVVLQPSRIATAGLAAIFVGTTPLAATGSDTKAASAAIAASNNSEGNSILSGGDMYHGRGEPRLLRVRIMGDAPTAEALQTTTVETDNNATIGIVLAQICRKRPFVKEDHFVLGVMSGEGEFVACGPDMPVARIPRSVDLCLQMVDNEGNPLVMEEAEAAVNQQQPLPAIISANAQPAAGGGGGSSSTVYHTFRVIRRAQMLFTRHERTLVIDGDVVTLMPSENRTMTESSKTLTFHISNILCQRNQKSPRRIRLFVSRRGNAGDKTIDLEAASEEDAFMMCTIITRLHDQYTANGTIY